MLFLRKNITKTLAKCILRNVFLQNLFYLKKISPELQMHPSEKMYDSLNENEPFTMLSKQYIQSCHQTWPSTALSIIATTPT